jgi:hypothetical protein
VLATGQVNKNYNLWSRNPRTVAYENHAGNSLPGARGYDGPSY